MLRITNTSLRPLATTIQGKTFLVLAKENQYLKCNIFLCHHHPFDCCINLILVCEINHLEIWLESVMNALNANDVQNNSPHLVPPTKYCSWSTHSSLPSLFGGRGWSYPSKSAIVLLIMAATALVWYFSIKSLAKSIENSFANGKTIN